MHIYCSLKSQQMYLRAYCKLFPLFKNPPFSSSASSVRLLWDPPAHCYSVSPGRVCLPARSRPMPLLFRPPRTPSSAVPSWCFQLASPTPCPVYLLVCCYCFHWAAREALLFLTFPSQLTLFEDVFYVYFYLKALTTVTLFTGL